MGGNHLNELFRNNLPEIKQHLKYREDPCLFMQERWLAYDANSKKFHNLTPYEYQLDFIKTIHQTNNNIIVHSRQMGVSAMMQLYIAWYVLFNYDKLTVIVSHSLDSGKRILEGIKIILQNYSVDDKKNGEITKTYFHWEDDFLKNSKTELKLKNGCRIKVVSPTADAGCGEAIDFLYIDEAAFIKDFKLIHMSLGMATSCKKDSKMIFTSIPKDNSHFNNLYINSEINKIRLHWSINPIYSTGITEDRDRHSPYQHKSPWFDELIKNRYQNNVKYVEQELECVVNYEEQTSKLKTISLRVNDNLYKRIQLSLNDNDTASDYIRRLIEKDLDNQDYKL